MRYSGVLVNVFTGYRHASNSTSSSAPSLAEKMFSAGKFAQQRNALVVAEFGPLPDLLLGSVATYADSGERMDGADAETRAVRLRAFPGLVVHLDTAWKAILSKAPCRMIEAAT